MDTTIFETIQQSLKQHGFVLEAEPAHTPNSMSLIAVKEKATLFIQLTEGRRAEGKPWELAIEPFAATDPALQKPVLDILPSE